MVFIGRFDCVLLCGFAGLFFDSFEIDFEFAFALPSLSVCP